MHKAVLHRAMLPAAAFSPMGRSCLVPSSTALPKATPAKSSHHGEELCLIGSARGKREVKRGKREDEQLEKNHPKCRKNNRKKNRKKKRIAVLFCDLLKRGIRSCVSAHSCSLLGNASHACRLPSGHAPALHGAPLNSYDC